MLTIGLLHEIINSKTENLDDMFKLINEYGSIDEIDQTVLGIDFRRLYQSRIHGIFHSEKVYLFAYLMAKKYKLNETDLQIITDAAIYHDIGRFDDTEESFHGYAATLKISESYDGRIITDNSIYQNETNEKILKAIIEGHALDDRKKRITFDNYEIEESEYERYSMLYDILKDADALDRFRLKKISKCALDKRFLRTSFSHELISLADQINQEYNLVLDKKNYEILKQKLQFNTDEKMFFHGIGCNFFQLNTILEHGILSNLLVRQKHLANVRNFEGNNKNMWISVVNPDILASQETKENAFNLFIENSIFFIVHSNKNHSGVESRESCDEKGLPYKSGLYTDEEFIFESVPLEKIYAVVIPNQLINTEISKLNYFNGSVKYDLVLEKIQYYKKIIFDICNIELNDSIFENILAQMKTNLLEFESLNMLNQKDKVEEFLAKQDDFVNQINHIVAQIISLTYKNLLHKKEDDSLTVKEVVEFILRTKNVKFDCLGDYDTERIYVLNKELIKDDEANYLNKSIKR